MNTYIMVIFLQRANLIELKVFMLAKKSITSVHKHISDTIAISIEQLALKEIGVI